MFEQAQYLPPANGSGNVGNAFQPQQASVPLSTLVYAVSSG
jgi:hypothetical protein